jgi:MFS family permease
VVSRLGGIRIYSWAFSAFRLAATITTPTWGRLTDHLGCRRTDLGGLAVFLPGSALSSASQSMNRLIVFRAVQGSAFLVHWGQARDWALAQEPVGSSRP